MPRNTAPETEADPVFVKMPKSFEEADALIEEIRKTEKSIHPKTKEDAWKAKRYFSAAYAALERIKQKAGEEIALNEARIDALLKFVLKYEASMLEEGAGTIHFSNGNRIVITRNPICLQFLDNDEHEAGKEILSLKLAPADERMLVRIQVMRQEAEDRLPDLVNKGAKRLGRGNNRKVQIKVATPVTERAEKRLTHTWPGEITEI